MLRRRPTRLAAATLAALALLGVGAAGADPGPGASASAKPKPKPKIVTVNDFYFGPASLTIGKGASVRWVWSSANTNPHDVHLKSGPKGLKQKRSYSTKTTAVSGASFQKSFPTPGTYQFICTLHPKEMKFKLVVRR